MKARALALAVTAVAGAAASSGAQAAKPKPAPTSATTVEVWGQANQTDETSGRPLGSSLGLFRSTTHAAALPATPRGISLASVAAHMRGDPGRLLLSKTRRVSTPIGAVYLVPTDRGWVCAQSLTFATCHRGLLRAGVTWSFYTTSSGIDVLGIAADDVSRVILAGGAHRWTARLHDNVFFVSRALATASAHLPPLGTLAVSYRGRTRVAHVPLR